MLNLVPPPFLLFGAMAILTFALACVIQYSDSLINCLNVKTNSFDKSSSYYKKISKNLMVDRIEEENFKKSYSISATKISKKNKGNRNYKYDNNNQIPLNNNINFLYISSVEQNNQWDSPDRDNPRDIMDDTGQNSESDFSFSSHYTCPPTTVESLRKRFGRRRSLWGEWSSKETRQFYKTQLPTALQIDGSMGLSLEERAKLASQSRHALRIYARERCHLPGRLLARLYDGIRHLHDYGYWNQDGMSWEEVKFKYARQAHKELVDPSQEEVEMFVYRKIVDKACSTNVLFDKLSLGQLPGNEQLSMSQRQFRIREHLSTMSLTQLRSIASSLSLYNNNKDKEEDFPPPPTPPSPAVAESLPVLISSLISSLPPIHLSLSLSLNLDESLMSLESHFNQLALVAINYI